MPRAASKSKKTKSDAIPKAIVSVKLGASCGGPTKRMLRDIRETAEQCNAIRTMGEGWVMDTAERSLQFMLDNYGMLSVAECTRLAALPPLIKSAENKLSPKRKPKEPLSQEEQKEIRLSVEAMKKELAALREKAKSPKQVTGLDRVRRREQLILSSSLPSLVNLANLYNPQMVGAFPGVASCLVAACCQDVVQRLTTKMPWFFDRPKPKASRVWQGILLGESQRDVWNSLRVPVLAGKNQVSRLTHNGDGSPYVLDFPLFSRGSHRRQLRARCRLDVREHRKRSLIARVVANPLLFRDSEIIYDTDREQWTLQLVHASTQREPRHIENVAELLIAPPTKPDEPFVILRDGDKRPWWIGRSGRYLVYKDDYLWRKKKVLGLRYRDSQRDAKDGHGRAVVYKKLRPQQRAVQDRHKQLVKDVINDVLRYCQKYGIGRLVYREPSMPLRNGTWFSRNGVPFNWSTFSPRLVARLSAAGVLVEVKGERVQQHCERWGVESSAVFARVSERVTATEVESVLLREGGGQTGHHSAPLANSEAERTEVGGYGDGGEVGESESG